MKNYMKIPGMVMALSLCMSMATFAQDAHTQACYECHKSGASPRAMANVCTPCHGNPDYVDFALIGKPQYGSLNGDKASDAMGKHPTPATGASGDQTSHFWGGSTTTELAAGSTNPPTTFYYSRYSISKNRVTCTICHEPHGVVGNKLLRKTTADDLICQQCHTGFYIDNPRAYKTHPIGNYAAAYDAAPAPKKFKPTGDVLDNATQGITLVNGNVSCTSCHAPHFADSDSSTADGLLNAWNLNAGDGHLLKADGPSQVNKSVLCQTCHTYKEHGKVGNDAAGSGAGDVQIGCLVCHSGHSYDAAAPNYYVLRKTVDSTIAGFGSKTDVLYTTYPTPWATYCGSCHGLIDNLPNPGLRGAAHSSAEDCTMCHEHSATSYSFGKASSGTACSSCHGAPPRTDTAANRDDNTVPDTGYAVGTNGINYRSANQNGKNETTTPHKRHAGALNDDKVSVDYAFGSGTVLSACIPCHNDKDDAVNPPSTTHDEADSNLSFQDIYFNSFATYNGVLTPPAYSGTWTCSGIYCHSNGGKRTGAAKVLTDFKTATTPSWLAGSNNTTNIGTIVGTATECQQCHGENTTTMDSGAQASKKNNSQSHDKHLLKYGDLKTSCYLCHSATVDSTGTIPASARDHRTNGTHVNGTVNVVFSTSALNTELIGGTYPPDNSGTCVVYCHSDAIGGPPALVPDWDFATGTIVCGSCHGITAATLTSGSHPIHINSTKAKIKCSSCHDTGADTGIHGGHVNGVVDKMTDALSCNLCHGVELASGKSWDVKPTWGSAATVDCRTCHTGTVLTSYVNTSGATIAVTTVNNLSKPLHESDGHSRTTPYTLTGKPAGNKNCTACHVMPTPANTGHVDGLGTSKLLIGGFSCEACHTAAGSRYLEATVRVQSHGNQTAGYTKKAYNAAFTKTCLACHDPHGTSNGAMIENLRTRQNAKDATGNYAGNVVFSSLLVGNSFDEADSGASANNDDICATCHSTALHNNRAAAAINHHEGENCTTTCHGHNGDKGGFMPSNGTACNDCHGNPPTASDPRPADSVGAHAAHTKVGTHEPSEDMYDCAVCHQGGESFTLDGAHSTAPLVAAIGYNSGDGTCSNACHLSSSGDGYWNDPDGLDCTSCHYYAANPSSGGNIVKPVTPTHNKHFDADRVCIDCHTDNSADGGPHPDIDVKRTHITDHVLWSLPDNDGIVLADRGAATQDEATVIVPTWNDGANTCSNAACHNPSGLSNSATWGTPNAVACNFCHSNTNPDAGKVTPGSHGAHMNAAGTFGITTIACTSCHPNNTINGHLNSAVDLNGGFAYSTSLTDYTSSTWGRCTTTTCHNNGRGVAVQTPVAWGTTYDNCSICHAAPPAMANSRHAEHVANTGYIANPDACGKCHLLATVTQITATTHIDGIRNVGNQISDMDLAAGGNQLVAPGGWNGTCANACHLVDTTGTWTDATANKLACLECHVSGKIGGAPASGLHVGPLTVSGNPHDDNFQITRNEATPSGTCITCHSGINLGTDLPATHYAGGAAAPAQAALATDINYTGGSPSTCAPKVGMANCHDDRGGWSRKWSATARTDATPNNECGNCHGDFNIGWVSGVSQRHNDPQVAGGHNGIAGEQCYICHTYKEGSTLYYTFANGNQHRDGTIQHNSNGMGLTDDGATVHCTGCHTTPLGLADGSYSFQDTLLASGGLSRWNRQPQPGPVANCSGCHETYGRNHGNVGTESLAVHNAHSGSPLNAGLSCGACHLNSGPGGANHENTQVDFGGTYMSGMAFYSVAAFPQNSCTGANENGCHNSQAGSWVGDTLSSCADCHDSGKLLDQGVYPPTSNAHGAHLGNAFYVGTVGTNACDPCHGAGSSVFNSLSTHSDGNVDVINQVSSYTLLSAAGNGTCTNSCHTVVSGRDWNGGTLACLDCHEPSPSISLDVKNYTSGLHRTAGVLAHDGDFPRPNAAPNGSCTSCHTAINLTSPSSHVNGVNTDPNTTFGLIAGYDTAASTCSGAGVATNCHSDGGDWTRKWNNVFNAKPLPTDNPSSPVCRNCHGTFAQGWNSLSASHIDPDPSNADDQMQAAGHAICEKCHGWGNANYNRTWLGSSNVNYDGHGDGHITMNGPAPIGTGYNPATGGCDTINCHGATVLTMNYNSGWSFNYGDFGGAGACGSCHSGGKTPVSSSGAHDQHGASLSDQTTCYPCHPNVDYTQGHGATGSFVAGITYTNVGGDSNPANDTCTTTICHSPAGNPATWGTPASVGCNECHYYGGTGEALSASHTKHLTASFICTDCHADNSGDTSYPRTHMDATSGLLDKANAAMNEAALVAGARGTGNDPSEAAPGNATCNNAQCHNPSGGYLVTWLTDSTGNCNFCHSSTAPVTGSHPQHMTAGGTFGRTVVCNDCHVNNGSNTAHRDGPVSFNGSTAYAALSCSTSLCHESAVGVDVPSPNWGTDGAVSCGICHTNQPDSGAHIAHFSNLYGPITDTDCSKCHAANANNTSMAGRSSHISGTVNFIDSGNQLAATTSCTTCHGGAADATTAKGNWAAPTRVTCESCHDATPATINSIEAPIRSDANFTTTGHGKSGVLQACTACHAENSAHISIALGDANRLDTIGADFAVNPNTFCSTCHVSGSVEKAHYADGGDALSNNGHQCALCHEPHGFGGQDAMIRTSINSKQVVGFSDRSLEASYYVLTPNSGGNNQYGICQVCHAANDANASGGAISYFNTTTAAATGHADQSCTGCHSHSSTPAFNSSSAGCTTCHGNVANDTPWPDGDKHNSSYEWADDQAGSHEVHIEKISAQMDGDKDTAGTLDEKKATCNYCHPNPGGSGHSTNDVTLPSGPSRVELLSNGLFRYLIDGSTNGAGEFNYDTDGTCSTLKCHARAPFTPGWHGDTIDPADVILTTAAGPVPRSIKVSWIAPGDDGNIDGTAYKYDIRMSKADGGAAATDFGLTTNYVQGVPTVKRMGRPQEAIIHNVDPSTTYYFALRTYDETGRYGESNTAYYDVPAAVVTGIDEGTDEQAPRLTGSPEWYGLDSARALDQPGTVKLSWTRAEDHSMPITYDIWWSTGDIIFTDTPLASTQDTSFLVTGLNIGESYKFAVRAKDKYNNRDTNTTVLTAVTSGLATVPKTGNFNYANGTATSNIPMLATAHTTDGTTATLPAVFIGPTTFAKDTNIFVNSFSINVVNTNVSTTMRAELGYITGTSTWNSFDAAAAGQAVLWATDQVVAKRANRLVTFKFNGAQRLMKSTMNGKLGVRVSVSSGAVTSINWGPTSKGGILSYSSQPVNSSPGVPTVSYSISGANVSIWWAPSLDATDDVADTVHYDVYADDGINRPGTFPYLIASGLTTNATSGAPFVWNTQGAGIALGASNGTVRVKVEAGDTINGKVLSHAVSTSANLNPAINNSSDNIAPGTINNFKAETRPKQGSVYLTWTAPGDDGTDNGRASSYDIRWSTAGVIDTEGEYTAATQLTSEPYPDFGGNGQGYEVLDLPPGTNYYFAIKAVDDGVPPKTSPLAYTSVAKAAGPKCGICHSTPPDETLTEGNHAKHGYTLNDCSNCHGNDVDTGAQTFTVDHQDGQLLLGWKTPTPTAGTIEGTQITYTQGGQTIYTDPSGGGFNVVLTDTEGDLKDNGTCFAWSSQQVSGCHGPAASALWDANPANKLVCSACHGIPSRPTDNYDHSFDDPSEDINAAPPVDNHGYDPIESDPVGERKYVGAHIAHLNYSFRLSKGDSCRLCHGASRPGENIHADGNIDMKLDLAAAGPDAVWIPGVENANPALATAGRCSDMSDTSCHPKDILAGGTAPTPTWDSAEKFSCTQCHGMGGATPTHVTDKAGGIELSDNDPQNDPDGLGPLPADPMPGNCTWCHVGGHPKEKDVVDGAGGITKAAPAVVTTVNDHNLQTGDKITIHTKTGMTEINNKTFIVTKIDAKQFSLQGSNTTAYSTFDYGTWIEGNGTGIILVPNDDRVGINYSSGGIHIKATIGAYGEKSSEAELCWGCHGPNGISEWGADNSLDNGAANNTATKDVAVGNGNYNFGTLTSTPNGPGNWIGAIWQSGTPAFSYKNAGNVAIRSTHSTDPTGTVALAGVPYGYTNGGVDVVSKIRCSNCHDVHNSNRSPKAADGLDPTGPPYLRGTWMSNPYKEDGAPQLGTNYTAITTAGQPGYGYGAVPRASTSTTQLMGGYWIDQNSGYPTATWSYDSSAALCQLCHQTDVNVLDTLQGGTENLWITTTNGHRNSVLGGAGTGGANIFFNGAGGRNGTGGAAVIPNPGAWMGFEGSIAGDPAKNYPYGPRSTRGTYILPYNGGDITLPNLAFAWGNSVDATTVEGGYHQFSCSKCHNPHASRLPKLMITNCLDVAFNTWDNSYSGDTSWSSFNSAASSRGTNRISHLSTAQNCHRYIDINNDNTPDEKGWNKVTPWGTHP